MYCISALPIFVSFLSTGTVHSILEKVAKVSLSSSPWKMNNFDIILITYFPPQAYNIFFCTLIYMTERSSRERMYTPVIFLLTLTNGSTYSKAASLMTFDSFMRFVHFTFGSISWPLALVFPCFRQVMNILWSLLAAMMKKTPGMGSFLCLYYHYFWVLNSFLLQRMTDTFIYTHYIQWAKIAELVHFSNLITITLVPVFLL